MIQTIQIFCLFIVNHIFLFSFGDNLMMKISQELPDEFLEIQNNKPENSELDECFDEDDLHKTSDVHFEDNHQSQNISQELQSELAQQKSESNS
jgi:hypothetical protein